METILSLRTVQAILLSAGVFAKNWSKKKTRHGDTCSFITLVSLNGFRCGFVHFELTHQRMIWPEPWIPENLLRTESGGHKAGFVVQKFDVSGILKRRILANYARCVHLSNVFRPCQGLLTERSHPACGKDMACRDDSLLYRQSYKQYFSQKIRSQNFGRKENPRHGDTVSFITLVSLDGFRCGVVNFELTHQRMIWPELWIPENLLRTESGGRKAGFVVQKSHVSRILKMMNFGELRSLRAIV